ncbi:HNH endonuclease [Trebonia sp.]|uniref:HNH endonuclease n=1 Tax=Trebonia sp. TaxID=2767075 RepID=UPI0026088E8F|nr:HNH endonuclease [Trebonia sp.]
MVDEGRRNPDWEWDEIVLACDLVMQNGGRWLPAENPQVIELSELLQKMTIHPPETRRADFRNPNGVGRKTADIATSLPGYTGRPTNGGRRDKEVIARFLAEPDVMHVMAEATRASVASGEPADFPRDVGYEGESEMEGRYLLRWHAYRERNPTLRRKKVNSVVAAGRPLACEVCEFDFGQTYGERGRGYIECHHVEPLHVGGEGPRSILDLALLCSNCHRMIHTKPPWPTPAELREIIRQSGVATTSARAE